MPTFDPYGQQRPCLWCEHFGGYIAEGLHARCVRDGLQIQADPALGCSHWVRATGNDDEPDKGDAKD
jgi:hypothetical protein